MTREMPLYKLRSLKPGGYHCFLYESDPEASSFAVSFIRQGLDRKEKIIYFAADHSADNLAALLEESGVDVGGAIKSGQLQIESNENDSYEKMLNDLAALNAFFTTGPEGAPPAGYSSLRIGIDFTDRMGDSGPAGLYAPAAMERLEGILRERCLMVFMYGMNHLSPEVLFRVLVTYPSLIIGDDVYDNFLFRDNLPLGQEEMTTLKVEHLLDLLRDHRKLEETIKKGGEALKASEENYRSIFESAANLIATVDKKGKIIDCNGKIEEVLGYIREEVMGRSIAALFHPEHLPRALETLKEVIKKGSSYNKQYKMVKKDGSTVYVSVNTTPLKNEKGKIAKVVSVVEDITERKGAEEALFESEKRYRQLIEILPDAIITLTDGMIIFANSAAYNLFGLAHPRDLIGRRMQEFVDSCDAEPLKHCFETIEQKGRTDGPARIRIVRPGGAVMFTEWTGTSFTQKDKDTTLFVGRDITERKLAEDLLKESEERYRTAIESSNDGVAIIRGEFYLYVNRRFAEIFGYRGSAEVTGKRITIIIHPDDIERVLDINHMRQRGEDAPPRYEFKAIRKDGSIVYIEVSATPIMYQGESASLIYLRDITSRKEMEEKLKMIGT